VRYDVCVVFGRVVKGEVRCDVCVVFGRVVKG
jgi:hypothetical protein